MISQMPRTRFDQLQHAGAFVEIRTRPSSPTRMPTITLFHLAEGRLLKAINAKVEIMSQMPIKTLKVLAAVFGPREYRDDVEKTSFIKTPFSFAAMV